MSYFVDKNVDFIYNEIVCVPVCFFEKITMKKNKYDKDVYRSLTLITQFGINMLVPIFLCTFLGIFLDKKLGTNFLVIILFFLGAAAGARNVYIFARGIYDKPKKGDKQ